jgi:DNA-binding FadR family transcriptional regulator
VNAAERLARRIAGELLSGHYASGAALPNEAEMAEDYRVGRSTVREALRILEGWGAVRMKRGRNGGPIATRPDVNSIGDHLGIVMQFEGVTLADLFETRRVLDSLVAGVAARTMSDADVLRLGDTIRAMSESIDDLDAYMHHNERFYEVLTGSSGNRSLQIIISAIQTSTARLMFATGVPREWRELSVALRSRVFRAIASRDAAAAEQAMDGYRRTLQDKWAEWHPEDAVKSIDVLGTTAAPTDSG